MNPNLYHAAPGRSFTSRLYETERDLLQMQGLLMAARARTADWRYAHVVERKQRTFVAATAAGRRIFKEHVAALEAILKGK